MNDAPIITLTSDFGPGLFVGAMKGVILQICPSARLVDIDHGIPAQNVRAGALVLEQVLPFYPPGCVHLAVVDPGVGTSRKPICLVSPQGLLVGPDNGLFSLLMPPDNQPLAYEISNPEFLFKDRSYTFHGRDVFAPAAAHLACGLDPAQLGPPVSDPIRLDWPQPYEANGILYGQVIWVDRFGNMISNLSRPRLDTFLAGRPGRVQVGDIFIEGISAAYGQAPAGEAVALINSSGRLELALNQGNLAKELGVDPGQAYGFELTVEPVTAAR